MRGVLSCQNWQKVYEGYVPPDIGLGKEDDIVEFSTCLDCGQMRGKFPLKPTGLEMGSKKYPYGYDGMEDD